jgi:hypothetical protein
LTTPASDSARETWPSPSTLRGWLDHLAARDRLPVIRFEPAAHGGT